MSKLIAEAITEYLGERCADFDADCLSCKTWAEYDALSQARADGRREGLNEAAEMSEAIADLFAKMADEGGRKSIWNAKLMANFRQHADACRALAQKEGKDGGSDA